MYRPHASGPVLVDGMTEAKARYEQWGEEYLKPPRPVTTATRVWYARAKAVHKRGAMNWTALGQCP